MNDRIVWLVIIAITLVLAAGLCAALLSELLFDSSRAIAGPAANCHVGPRGARLCSGSIEAFAALGRLL